MHNKIISFEPGTGGNKACLYDLKGNCLASAFVPYSTQYTQVGLNEQRPLDWGSRIKKITANTKSCCQFLLYPLNTRQRSAMHYMRLNYRYSHR